MTVRANVSGSPTAPKSPAISIRKNTSDPYHHSRRRAAPTTRPDPAIAIVMYVVFLYYCTDNTKSKFGRTAEVAV
jgi:hypothetical protein